MEYNIGNAFDENTGTFTCQHDGIYSFYATSPVYDNQYAKIYIYINGSNKVYHFINVASSRYDHSSPHGVFKLKKGDTVHMVWMERLVIRIYTAKELTSKAILLNYYESTYLSR